MFDLHNLIKYLLEGLAVAVAAYLIPRKKVDPKEIVLIALTAAAVFAVLDQFAPQVAIGARQGTGFGIGLQQVGFGGYGFEGFDDQPIDGMDEGLEGYDDYENEGFQDANVSNVDTTSNGPTSSTTHSPNTTSSSTTDDDNLIDKNNVCKMNGDTCTYNPDVKQDQKAHFLCRKDNDQCNPLRACKKDSGGQCDWETGAIDLPDAAGRMCHSEDVGGKKVCRMTPHTEGFISSSDEIAGFEGFSKVF